jgi:hypothetical protein
MRLILFAIAVVGAISIFGNAARATDACKVCSDQQRACMKNYAGPTCKTEFQMCMKSCKAPKK